jgi:hypothetical protein
MRIRALFSFAVLLFAAMITLAASDTNQTSLVANRPHGFHQIRPWAVGCGMHGTVVKFELMEPKMDFGENSFTLMDVKVWRVTDIDL